MRRRFFAAVSALALVIFLAIDRIEAQPGAPVTGEWRSFGGDLGASRYAPLDQINRDNFSTLKITWRWRSPDALLGKTMADGSEWVAGSDEIFKALNEENPKRWKSGRPPSIRNFKATPLMVGGLLYVNTPIGIGAAVDAKTGETVWTFNPKSYEEGTGATNAIWNQRGVAYWSDANDARIFWGTSQGYLICVDAKTGRPCPDFGSQGRVDLTKGIPRADRTKRDWHNALPYSVQSPPIVVRNTVITPMNVGGFINKKDQPPGWLRGFDVKTGRVKWVFHTIPQPGEFGNDTWGDDSWSYNGKVGPWSMMSADEQLGYVYVPMSTPSPDYYGGQRPGDNLYSEGLLVLDVETGKRVWHFQFVHHGLWDYDVPAAPNLLDVTVNGQRIKAVAQVTKQGFVFAFDRVTGRPLWPIEERPVPTDTDVKGEVPSPTQPFPTKPAPFEYQGTSIDDLVDFTPEIRKMAIEAVKGYRLGPLYTPHMLKGGTVFRPNVGGGASWSGAAVDPDTGILYVPSNNSHSMIKLVAPDPGSDSDLRYIQVAGKGGDTPDFGELHGPRMPGGLPLWKPPYTRMTAIDMNSGDHVWMTPLGNGDYIRNHPMLKPLNLPPLGGDGKNGQVLTKTLLITTLTAGGTDDGPRLVAYDKATGRELASVDLPAGAISPPMTYMLGGKQYISLTVGGRYPELISLTLP